MTCNTLATIGLLPLCIGAITTDATARPASADGASQSVSVTAETQEFSQGRGSLRTVQLEYKFDDGDTTVLVSPTIGERRAPGFRDTALGLGATLYQDWSPQVSTRTHAFVAEDKSAFAHIDVGQDVTVRVAKNTAVTAGVRWAEYFGGREATFLSLGARQYFRGGSVAYRLTRTSANGQKAFYAHLVNLTIKDGGDSDGKTQLWASTGAASLARAQFDASFSGKDRAFLIQRTQPISPSLALLISGGISSYASQTGRFTGTNIGLGLTADLD